MRLIDADRLINEFEGCGGIFVYGRDVVSAIISRINMQPTINEKDSEAQHVEEIKVGDKFILRSKDGNDYRITVFAFDCCKQDSISCEIEIIEHDGDNEYKNIGGWIFSKKDFIECVNDLGITKLKNWWEETK